MGKGSQLTKLKAALSQSGLAGNQQPKGSKKRKRSAIGGHDVAAEKARREKKLEEIKKSVDVSPFDVKVTKLKHEVGGRKVKGVIGRPGLSKQTGMELRRKKLLAEFEKKDRAGGIVDRRFGENDATLAPEERMLERFTKERQRASKGVNFNLEDDDEQLTHYGRSLAAVDDFDAEGLGLDDEDGDLLVRAPDGDLPLRTRSGAPGDEDEGDGVHPRKKSRSEVLSEVISRSKEHKYLRQLAKEENDEMREAMDKEFSDIRNLLFASKPDPQASGSNATPLGPIRKAGPVMTKQAPPDSAVLTSQTPLEENPVGDDGDDDDAQYDKLVHELALDKRAKPKDRTKTEEEIAADEAEKLRKAEKARLKRMLGEDDSEDDAEVRGGYKKRRRPQADDLEDDFCPSDDDDDNAYNLGKGLGIQPHDKADSQEDGQDESRSAISESGGEDESDDYGEQNSAVQGSDDEDEAEASSQASDKEKIGGKENEGLPFTFRCPTTHDEFLDIVEGIDPSDLSTVVHRIRTIYHPSLAEGNTLKLKTLVGILIEHRLHAAASTSSFSAAASLEPQIISLAKSYSIEAATAIRSKLVLMQKNLMRGLARGATQVESKTFPGVRELVLLRFVGEACSTSDKKHPVVTPAMLLMGQYLSQGRVRHLSDLGSGLFLCTLFFNYQRLSKRLIPEAINFLINSLLHLSPHTFAEAPRSVNFPPLPDFKLHTKLQLGLEAAHNLTPGLPNLEACLLLVDPDSQSNEVEQHKLDLLSLTYTLLLQFAKLYVDLDGFAELFEPVMTITEKISSAEFSEKLLASHTACCDGISRMIKFATESRKPLTLQSHKPIPIATYAPSFETAYSFSKHDPDPDRNESAKLKALYRKEFRGAMRELRKDTKYLALQKAKMQAEKDAAYKKKMARLHGGIQVERAEEKRYLRDKAKEKRRSGKR